VSALYSDNHIPKKTIWRPVHPSWVFIISVLAGTTASGPIIGATLYKNGNKRTGLFSGIALFLIGLFIFMFTTLWNIEWYWAATTLSAFNLISGIILSLVQQRIYRRFFRSHAPASVNIGSYRHICAGIVGGAFLGLLLGMLFTALYLLLIDYLFSTLMPVIFEDDYTIIRSGVTVFYLTLSGAVCGGLIGRFKPNTTPSDMIMYALSFLWVYFTWLLALECSIAIPGFQAGTSVIERWEALISPILSITFFIGLWWSVFMVFFIISGECLKTRISRFFQAALINMASALTIAILFGYTADMFLAAGGYMERKAYVPQAMWCYEHGLKKEPKDTLASYLQYRVALLNHKLGQKDKARQGFNRLIAKYDTNKLLVKKANHFIENIERAKGSRRVVLPGVETRTQYRGGYCVPNSLALVMRYWGADITARDIGERITGLGSGTFVVDQRWYAEQEGFSHDFLPLAGLKDIKDCIDAGFPVLVYVPFHIFAVVGYDEMLETFVTYDVATNDVWVEYIQKDFIKSWKKQATTLVLAYPPEKRELLPSGIRSRLVRLSDNYLHFQLHYFDAPEDSISLPHLLKSAGDNGDFFFPVTILYSEFPGMRAGLARKHDPDSIIPSIKSYFWDNFDEGTHLWGQYHNDRWAQSDWALSSSMKYLIGQKRFDLIEQILARIDEQGMISDEMIELSGMIDLAHGRFQRGLNRLIKAQDSSQSFYKALANLKIDYNQGMIQEMTKTVMANL